MKFDKYSTLAPVDVTTVQERVYQSLRLALLKGQFLPGDPVSIRKLAEALGTSPMPVREAVKRLVAEKGFVQLSDRLIRVAPYDPQIHEEYIRIRIQNEGYATERATMFAGPKLVSRLEEYNHAMLDASRALNVEAALAGNQALHFEIYGAADYPQLLEIISNLWLRTGPVLAAAQQSEELFQRVFENGFKAHSRAIAAISVGDKKAARRAITLDIRAAHFWFRHGYESFKGGSAAKQEK